MLEELATGPLGGGRPVLRLPDGRAVPVKSSEIAAARLMVVTSRRLGKSAPAWVEKLAVGVADEPPRGGV